MVDEFWQDKELLGSVRGADPTPRLSPLRSPPHSYFCFFFFSLSLCMLPVFSADN